MQPPSTPDPFGTHDSFGAHNNARLREFLDRFGFEYEFVSATECYQSGRFDEAAAEQKKTLAMVKEKGWDSITYANRSMLSILNDHLGQFEAQKPLRGGIY